MPADLPKPADDLQRASLLLWIALGVTLGSAVLMTADHLLHQKPAVKRQAAVFAAIGLSTPCIFPAGHPARRATNITDGIDWRPTPTLAPSPPGPIDLVRPAAVIGRIPASGR